MGGSKKWWESKTIWGIIVSTLMSAYTVLGMVLRLFGVAWPPLPSELQESLVEIALAVAGIAGAVMGIIGRIKAREVIE